MALAVISGGFGAFTIIYLRRFAELKATAGVVLSIRFYLVLLCSLLLLFSMNIEFALPAKLYLWVVLVAILSVAIPMLFFQKGLEKIDPVFVAFIAPFVPLITFFIMLINPANPFSWIEFCLLIALTIVIIISVLVKGRLSSK